MNLHVCMCAYSQLIELCWFPMVVQQAVIIQMLLSQVRKMGKASQLSCCSSSGFAALLLYIDCCELLNGWQGKRQWVRHSAVCFISTLRGNVAGRQRARVLAVLRWSEGAETWLSKEFLQDQLDPAELVQRSDSCSRPALYPIPWCKLYIRWESEHVKHLQGNSSLLLSSAERISLSQTRCVQYEPLLSSVPCMW